MSLKLYNRPTITPCATFYRKARKEGAKVARTTCEPCGEPLRPLRFRKSCTWRYHNEL